VAELLECGNTLPLFFKATCHLRFQGADVSAHSKIQQLDMANGEWIESCVPARLDRLPCSRWHWLIH